jgi:RNA-binding protein
LGTVLNVTPSQNIIIKSDKPQKIGVNVVDERLNVIGRTFDIIGPISSPYIVIKPKIADPKRLVGEKLYTLPLRKNRKRR